MALKVVYYYDNWVRKAFSSDSFDEPPLESSFKTIHDSAVPALEKLLVD
jgi:hypothetical protein